MNANLGWFIVGMVAGAGILFFVEELFLYHTRRR